VIKSQLTLNVAENFLYIRNSVVERAVNVVLDEIVAAMARKDRVELRGFGVFCSKDRAGRIARNPKSGVKVEVPDKNVPVFSVKSDLFVFAHRLSRGDGKYRDDHIKRLF
jgi:integration host factor subunit beta